MVNGEMISERMKELGLKQKDIAKVLGIKPPTVSQKLSGVRPMTLSEAEKLADFLKIPSGEFGTYFFASSVGKYASTSFPYATSTTLSS